MNQERLFKVLLGPHITEKSAMPSGAATQVVFKVALNANKLEIKKAVEQLFEVKVDDVRVAPGLEWVSGAIGRKPMFDWRKVKILTFQ